ncbi:Uncharacterized protein Adt_38950 [Abeliophyllum distichum]|uniref:DDE Tnp4 domain-containing protein n=1 Tax=Abeliophyllum distichum TaxID=126358 RepID=A0ABD1Q6P9_9LAMI
MADESEEEMFIDAPANDELDSVSDSLDEEALVNLEGDTLTWLMYCRATTIHHYFNVVLRAVVRLGTKIIKPKPNYNDSPTDHRPDPFRHLYFQALMCFTFVLLGTTENVHDSRILARTIHSLEVNFSLPTTGKYYLFDSGFAYRFGYMASYKGADIIYHFQEFPPVSNSERRRFGNVRERFNFNHSSLRNTAVVVATMPVHNFLRCPGQVDGAFQAVDEVVDAVEIDLPDQPEETAADTFAPGNPNTEWDQLRDHITQMMR